MRSRIIKFGLPLLILAALVGLMYLFYFRSPAADENVQGEKRYENAAYGIAFSYPEGYVLTEREVGDAHRQHYAVMLVKEEDAAPRENSEGPTGITVDIYQNNIDQQSLHAFVTGTNGTNFKLSNGTYASTTVAGVEAVTHSWSGLYEADVTAFRQAGNIITVTVTYLAPTDEQRTVYEEVLDSFTLTETQALSEQEAIAYVQGMWPQLADYPSDNLPPKSILTERADDGWFIGFLMHGSGLPGIRAAECYFVSDAKEVRMTGSYNAAGAQPVDRIYLDVCSPKLPYF